MIMLDKNLALIATILVLCVVYFLIYIAAWIIVFIMFACFEIDGYIDKHFEKRKGKK